MGISFLGSFGLLGGSRGATQTYQEKVLALSPIAYFPMTEASGTAAVDLAGGVDGTYARNVTTMTTITGPVAGTTAPLFNGANDYINILHAARAALFNGDTGTLAIWVKVSAAGIWTDGTQRRIAYILADVQNYTAITRTTTDNQVSLNYRAGNTLEARLETVSTTAWFHVAITWNKPGEVVEYFLNGASMETAGTLGVWVGVPVTMLIGASNTTPTQVWSGGLAHYALFATPLTAPQVLSLATV